MWWEEHGERGSLVSHHGCDYCLPLRVYGVHAVSCCAAPCFWWSWLAAKILDVDM